jgi:hypothetical protein
MRDLKRWLLPRTKNYYWIVESGCADMNDMDRAAWADVAEERYQYNHSTFIDLILSGLVGLRPRADGLLAVNYLVPPGVMPWWTADGITTCGGKIVSVQYDLDGTKCESHHARLSSFECGATRPLRHISYCAGFFADSTTKV